MIDTVFQIALLRLWNNKQELFLALVVPILFFSIFAMIFGRGVGSGTAAIKVAIVDDDQSNLTWEVTRLLQEQPALESDLGVLYTNEQWPLETLTKTVIRETGTDVVIHLPAGMGHSLEMQNTVEIRLLSEGSNPVGRQIVSTMLSQAIGMASAKTQARNQLTSYNQQSASTLTKTPQRLPPIATASPAAIAGVESASDLISFNMSNAFGADKHNPKIAMYAAGIAVMFLLFSATGAGGSLLEEYEAGTLDRLLSSRLSVTELLAGKWLYITCLGCVQLGVMFAWAQFAFGVDLAGHIPGFTVMMLCTAAATASLAICLAVFCRSRAQLNGVSIILILTMSALGGSMVPRYIMSEEMQRWGQLTFNAWALDGFKKVFWYDLPVQALDTEVKVLLVMTVVLAIVARVFAGRWAAN